MGTAILLAVAASICTATSSVCQRIGARNTADGRVRCLAAPPPGPAAGLAARHRRMIGGFVLQLIALRYGALALVQPILAPELLFVFGYMAVAGPGG